MNAIKPSLKSWKSSLAGILAIAAAVASAVQDPAKLLDPQTIGVILGGIGLLVAKDAGVTGV